MSNGARLVLLSGAASFWAVVLYVLALHYATKPSGVAMTTRLLLLAFDYACVWITLAALAPWQRQPEP